MIDDRKSASNYAATGVNRRTATALLGGAALLPQAARGHRSTTFATEANLAETGAQTLVSMQAGLVSGPLRFTAFVNNLFDNKVIDSARAFVDPTSFRRTFIAQLPAPRQFGLRVAFRY